MADFHRCNPSKDPARCNWCGRKLRKYRWADTEHADGRRLGDYGDNFFCGLRCGYQFGVRLAELGSALVLKK